MPNRMLLPAAAKTLGVTEYFLRQGIRAGRIPAYRPPHARGRYIIDVDQVNDYLSRKAMENVKPEPLDEDEEEYGKIRRVK